MTGVQTCALPISKAIIEKNKKQRPDWDFIVSSADVKLDISANTVFCFDLLFHIMDNDVYEAILQNICDYSTEWIFLFTWEKNPFNKISYIRHSNKSQRNNPIMILKNILNPIISDGDYQCYRKFPKYYYLFKSRNFKLIKTHSDPNSIGKMYIFRKKSSLSEA